MVKFADTIAYIGRDLQDARDVGLIDDKTPLPDTCARLLGDTNRGIINTLIYDLLENSDSVSDGYISYSPEIERALIDLRAFSRKNIYENPRLTGEQGKIEQMYRTLFARYLEDLEKRVNSSAIFTEFLRTGWIDKKYVREAHPPELVRDFIAGMTDRYFARQFEECVIPRKVDGRFI